MINSRRRAEEWGNPILNSLRHNNEIKSGCSRNSKPEHKITRNNLNIAFLA
jgi:hypothetical protein